MLEEGGNNYVESFDRRRRRSATQAVWGLFPILRGCDNCDIVLWQGTDPEWLGKRCREPWHRWNQLDLLFEHSKSLKSEDPMICFHLRQLGGEGVAFCQRNPFSGPWQISNKIPPDEYAEGQEHKQDCDSEAVSGRSRGFSAQFRPLIAQARIHTSSHWTEMQKTPYLPRAIWAYPGGVGAP